MLRYIFPLYLLIFETISASVEKGGMQQLNPESFSSQIFWLTLLFIILFLVNHYFFLPKIKNIRKKRDETIQNYLDEAKKLNDSFNSLVEKMNKEFEEEGLAFQINVPTQKQIDDWKNASSNLQ